MLDRLKTPAEAAEILHISRSTITRCKNMGAPVRYIGTCGRKYLIDTEVFAEWMNAQGMKEEPEKARQISMLELRARRHSLCG